MEYTEQQKQIYNEVCDKYKHHWLNTTVSQTMAMEMISKALAIYRVSCQREQLKELEKLTFDDFTHKYFEKVGVIYFSKKTDSFYNKKDLLKIYNAIC